MHKMKSQSKVKGNSRFNTQQVAFELKQRVLLSLNKLADRDTCQIGTEELEKVAEGLTPEGLGPFLSCILDTDSEQKSAVRKECIRIIGTMARFHGELLGSHLGKMVSSIVKRIKDPDSIVRDACVETMGVLASTMVPSSNNCGGGDGGPFLVLVKPLFEALGEQNRQVQSGSALCLARVIENAIDPPRALLQKILARVIKLLKNQHFMAKPALVELIGSIIQVGGASTTQALSAAVISIREALKSSEWTTRKAASVALTRIAASYGGSQLDSFKASCITSLESCRFDKVKPVRDSVLQALQYWRTLQGADSRDPSEAGSSTKENFCGGDDLTSGSDSGWKLSANLPGLIKKRAPLTVKKTCPNYSQNSQHSKTNDWQIEIAVPKTHAVSLVDTHNEESEDSCVTKTFEGTNMDATSFRDVYDDMPIDDDKPECSSISDLVTKRFKSNHVTVAHSCLQQAISEKPMEISEAQVCSLSMRDRKSLGSTVTELSSQGLHGCANATNELTSIRKQLVEIENKQSDLLDLLQAFMGSSMESLSVLQSRVLGLEQTMDKIAEGMHCGSCSNTATSRIWKGNHSISSPRLSTSTPRPSTERVFTESQFSPMHRREHWEHSAHTNHRSRSSIKQGVELWDSTLNVIKNPMAKGVQESLAHNSKSKGSFQTRKVGDQVNDSESKKGSDLANNRLHGLRKCADKDFVRAEDLESAFVEALCSGNDLLLIELMDRTGPILERLSRGTVREILSNVALHLLEHKFLDSIIPWLQQLVDLSTICEPNFLALSAKAKRELLLVIKEAASMHFAEPADRRCVTQVALRLSQVWGETS